MERPCLFLSGEFRATQPAVFRREKWQHTMSAKKLFINGEMNIGTDIRTICRENFKERIKGIIYYNRTDDFNLEQHNLQTIIISGLPCWPDPATLLTMSSRHDTLFLCKPYINHFIFQGNWNSFSNYYLNNSKYPFEYPFVLKTGEDHRGQNKFLIKYHEDFPKFEGIATAEPFFEGESCRVLFIGNKTFGIKYFNDTSWIKNSCGADIEIFDPPQKMVDHARLIQNLFHLEISGSDYILLPNGDIRFLEINQYPGVDGSDEINETAQKFFDKKMEEVENKWPCI